MGINFFETIVRYLQFQLAKFIGGLLLFYLIFQNLDVSSYAMYGIVQSFTMVCSLLVGFNIQASFQKLYSMHRIQRSVNLVVLVVLVLTSLFFSFSFWLLYQKGIYPQLFNGAINAPGILVVYMYILSFSLMAIVIPLLNAQRKTFLYGISTTLPVLIAVISIVVIGIKDLDGLLAIISISNLALLSLMLALNVRIFCFSNYSSRHFRKIFRYTFGYTWLSIPTLGSRYVIDLAARSLLLSEKGYIAVAIITFSTSLFTVFRSIEQGFFRAVTPFFMKNSRMRDQQFALTKRIIMGQSILTILFFASSPLWIGFLMKVFPTKPAEVFAPLVLVLMALITVISYYKNYYLSRVKKNVDRLKKFFIISIMVNLCILSTIYIINLSVINFLLIQILFMTCHFFLVRNIERNHG